MPSKSNTPLPSPSLSTAYDLLILSTIHSEALLIPSAPTDDAITFQPRLNRTPTEDLTQQAMSSTTNPSAYLIACVESYISPALPIGTSLSSDATAPALHIIPTATLSKLKNLGPARVKDMRNLGQSKQIVSHVPIVATPTNCSKFNDALYASVQLQSEKIAALAMLPSEGKAAAQELMRCVTKMKFVGGVVGLNSMDGGALSDQAFEYLWATAEKHRVPIALRELWPTGAELANYHTGVADTVRAPLATHIHTAHNTSPMPILKLYLAGIFDRHPSLRLIISHPGILPPLLPRIDTMLVHIPTADRPKRNFLEVWQHNFYFTTADVLDISTMRTLLEQIPIDRVLYASNYPLEERGKELMEELKDSEFLTQDEWERVAWRNAELLFGFKKGVVKSAGERRL